MLKFKKSALIVGSFLLVFSLLLLNDGSLALANESEVDELTNLTYKVEGTYQGEPAEYWYRFKDIGTEEEYVRFDVSPLESEETRIVILDKKNKKVIYKEMGSDSWLEGSSMMFSLIWSRYREGAISRYGDAEDWREWAESDRDEFLLEDEEEHEEYTVRAYDIEVDEPIDDSVFTPNGS